MPNRLADESSPYLLQHKDNPVDWYPWGPEALSRAEDEDKPIFLSIGYSACHWCHVMEHESFEDPRIAQLLNENFVSIKVDREERPDLDQIYMNAVMALQRGQGGWPLNVFLTPQQEVFFGGTYWPPTSRLGMPGFDQVLRGVLDAYLNRRDQVNQQSQQITQWLNRLESGADDNQLDRSVLYLALESLHSNFDFEHGGFGSAPKFPHATDLLFLAQMADRDDDGLPFDSQVLLEMVKLTLRKMAFGGIFDHLAGGFARYSVDAVWLVPHFEKMLYDNALLVPVYLETFQMTGDEFYSTIASEILNYLLRDMHDELGGFYSTEDADSEGEEGKFYVWSKSEIMQVLGREIGARFCALYNVTEAGNFEGHNILNLSDSYQQFAVAHSLAEEELRMEMNQARARLLAVRNQRVRPGRDDKILASWNALAISAFAQAAVVLDNDEYRQAARDAANFVLSEMRDQRNRLWHTWRHGQAKVDGFLDDYAGMIVALLDLYRVDFDQKWLDHAWEIANQMIDHFADEKHGGFYFTADDSEKLIARSRSFQDSSIPSGNAMAALGLLRLGRLTGSNRLIELAAGTVEAAGDVLRRAPLAAGQMLITLSEHLEQSIQLVLCCDDVKQARRIGRAVARAGNANFSFVILDSTRQTGPALQAIASGKSMHNGQPALYICRDHVCDQPIPGLPAIEATIDSILNSDRAQL